VALANALALLLYLVCSVTLVRHFVQRGQSGEYPLPIGLLTVLALIFHGSDIFFTMANAGGWEVGFFTTLSIVAWVMAFITFIIGLTREKAHPGIVIYPLVALALMLKTAIPAKTVTGLSDPALEWHVLLSLTAYSLFTLAALQAVVLAIQEQQLRKRQLAGFIQQLPPLQSMESSLFQLLLSGFLLLTIGLITGFVFLEDIFAQHLVHKTTLSLIAWAVFAVLLWGRLQHGWRSQTAVKWTLVGFLFLVLAYFGSKFVLEFILSS